MKHDCIVLDCDYPSPPPSPNETGIWGKCIAHRAPAKRRTKMGHQNGLPKRPIQTAYQKGLYKRGTKTAYHNGPYNRATKTAHMNGPIQPGPYNRLTPLNQWSGARCGNDDCGQDESLLWTRQYENSMHPFTSRRWTFFGISVVTKHSIIRQCF